VSCPAGEDCINSGSGIICGGGGPAPGTSCNGYPACGMECTNSLFPVCCPNGHTASTESECGSSSSGGCALSAANTDGWGAAAMGLFALALLRRRRPRA
jgi:MYXO-CTERM domain-containing protein